MEVTELVQRYIVELQDNIIQLKDVIRYLVSGLISLACLLGTFFFIYRKDKKQSDDRFLDMSKELMNVIRGETEAKTELKNTIEENTRVTRELPRMIQDTILTAIKLATK